MLHKLSTESILMKKHFNLFRLGIVHLGAVLPLLALLAFCASSCVPPPEGDTDVVEQSYAPPPWAPPYDNVSTVRYYYLPDYDCYYDVWDGDFWYQGPGGWVSTVGPPPQCAGVDLSDAFVVLIDKNIDRPWLNHAYYHDNYPAHGYDQYKDIVVKNRIVTNTEPGHELVPRAFNENTNRVTFMQRATMPNPPHPPPPDLGGQSGHPPAPVFPAPPSRYNRVVHKVPMSKISPSMPKESQSRNYGGGYSPARAPQGGGSQGGQRR
jgi:hypothetical protein